MARKYLLLIALTFSSSAFAYDPSGWLAEIAEDKRGPIKIEMKDGCTIEFGGPKNALVIDNCHDTTVNGAKLR